MLLKNENRRFVSFCCVRRTSWEQEIRSFPLQDLRRAETLENGGENDRAMTATVHH
jgi:hypothetical protein